MKRWLLAGALLPAFAATPGFAQYYAQPPGYATGQSSESDLTTQLLNRVTALEEEVRQLRGRVDDLQNTLNQSNADLGKRIDDMRFQLQNGAGGTPSAAPPTRVAANIASIVAQRTAATPGGRSPHAGSRAAAGLRLHKAGRLHVRPESRGGSTTSKRNSPRAYDAQYLLAQSLAGQHQWSRAAIAYDDAYNRSPKGSHAQTALLGLAISMTAINEKRAACETIAKLHTQFPKPNPELQPQIQGVVNRAGCK